MSGEERVSAVEAGRVHAEAKRRLEKSSIPVAEVFTFWRKAGFDFGCKTTPLKSQLDAFQKLVAEACGS